MAETPHNFVVFERISRLSNILFQPLAEGCIQSFVLGLGSLAGTLNQVLVRAQGYVFHTKIVYTKLVLIPIVWVRFA
jgi:hypothetical protein